MEYQLFHDDVEHLKFKHPFTCLVAGPTQSGKTVIVRQILEDWKHLIHLKNNVNTLQVIWYYGISQNIHNDKINNVNIIYIEGKPNKDDIINYKPNIVIIDDLMDELKEDEELSKIFTRESHHLNFSVIFILQNLYIKGSKMRTINLNSQYFLLTINRRDLSQITTFGTQCYPRKGSFFMDVYLDAINQQPYGYLLFDSHITTPENLRLRTNITLKESKYKDKVSPLIYEICPKT
jgi:hypothetical protein